MTPFARPKRAQGAVFRRGAGHSIRPRRSLISKSISFYMTRNPAARFRPQDSGWGPGSSLAIAAQPLEVDHRHAAIFEPQQTLLLEFLQALVGILPGHAGQRADFLLRDLQVTRQVRIKNGIEQRGDAAR